MLSFAKSEIAVKPDAQLVNHQVTTDSMKHSISSSLLACTPRCMAKQALALKTVNAAGHYMRLAARAKPGYNNFKMPQHSKMPQG